MNTKTIQVVSGKKSAPLQEMFSYVYDQQANRLTLTFKDADSMYGSGDGIDVFVSKEVKSAEGKAMGVDVHFGFSTK